MSIASSANILAKTPLSPDVEMYVPTGTDLRDARQANGVTQAEVADCADVSQPLLSRIENDDVDPRLSTLHRIAQAINNMDTQFDEAQLEVAIPAAVKEYRTTAGLTQSDLANRAGVSQPLIARIENETVNPRASTLRSILGEFKIDTPDSPGQSHSGTQPTETQSDLELLEQIEESFEQL